MLTSKGVLLFCLLHQADQASNMFPHCLALSAGRLLNVKRCLRCSTADLRLSYLSVTGSLLEEGRKVDAPPKATALR